MQLVEGGFNEPNFRAKEVHHSSRRERGQRVSERNRREPGGCAMAWAGGDERRSGTTSARRFVLDPRAPGGHADHVWCFGHAQHLDVRSEVRQALFSRFATGPGGGFGARDFVPASKRYK